MSAYQAIFNNPALAAGADGVRFLEQATWGPTDSDLAHLRSVGMQPYLNEQFSTPPAFPSVGSNYPATPLYPQSYPGAPTPPCDAVCNRDNYTLYPLQKQFMTNALTQPDQLRQRVAFALHKLLVVGGSTLNNNETSWYAPYLQTIDRNTFGNFRTLLFEITLNPGMGEYLNMRGNSVVNRANPTPNENYAREIMQLFSIGVDTLNQDGTPVLDGQGNRVPSYDQTTIANLARASLVSTPSSPPARAAESTPSSTADVLARVQDQPASARRPVVSRISPAVASQDSCLRLATTMSAPARAKPSAISRPKPRLPPVMRATRPVRSNKLSGIR